MRLANESSAGRLLFSPTPPLALSFDRRETARPRTRARPTQLENIVMTKKEDLVDFVARDGVTIYPSRSVAGYPAGSVVRLHKSHADAIAHLAANPQPDAGSDQEPAEQE